MALSSDGQVFTLEGISAALLLILATYAVFHSTVLISPSWSEFTNVQLKQLGYDTLRVFDSPVNGWKSLIVNVTSDKCSMVGGIYTCNLTSIDPEFLNEFDRVLDATHAEGRLEMLWVNGTNVNLTVFYPFNETPTPNAVRVSRFIVVNKTDLPANTIFNVNFNKLVVEVRLTLWRV